MKRSIVIMAQAPISGRVKKLCPPLNQPGAARLHECFLLDALEKATTIPDAEVVIACTPAESFPYFREIAPRSCKVIAQQGMSPTSRISRCFDRLCEHGRSVVMIATNHPDLPARSLELAFDALASGKVDVVLGPTPDRRFYLIGMNSPHPELFTGLKPDGCVLDKTIERAAASGMGWYLLPESQSIDTPADLHNLKESLLEAPAFSRSARHTLAHILKVGFGG